MMAGRFGKPGNSNPRRGSRTLRRAATALAVAAAVLLPSVVLAQSNPLNISLSGSSYLPMREFATRELGDAWDMSQRTDIGWYTWGVDNPPSLLSAKSVTTDARGNSVFRASASGWGPSFFALDTWVPGGGKLGKTGANHPIDTTVYKTLYVKMKVASTILNTAPVAQVFWSQDSIYHDGAERPTGGSIAAYDDDWPVQVGMYLSPYVAPTWGRVEGGNWIIVKIPLTLEGMKAVNATVDRWRNMSTGATVTWGAPGVKADSLRFSPYNLDGATMGDFQIDWMRLVDDSAPASMTVSWTSGTYDVVVSTQADCSDFAVVGYSRTPGFAFAPGILPAGTYRVGLRRPFSLSGHSAATPTTLASCSASTFTVAAYPGLTFTSPNPEGSADDFATNVLGNAWDFDALTDIDYSRNMTSFGLAPVAATDPAGNDLGTVSVFRNVNAPASQIGDAHIYPLWPIAIQSGARARGENVRIDASRYRILTAEVGVEHQRDLYRGSVARIIWHVDGDNKLDGNIVETESSDLVLRHLATTENNGKVVLETLQVDMADRASLPVETDTPQSNSGWNNACTPTPGYARCDTSAVNYRPGVSLFRFDFHEFPEATASMVKRIKLAALERTGAAFDIAWTPSNPSGLSATVTLKAVPVADPARQNYRPLDPTCASASAVTIASGLSLASGRYTWRPAAGLTDGGEYYVCAQIVAGAAGVVDETMSNWPVVVSTAAAELFTSKPGALRFGATKYYEELRTVTEPQTVNVSGPAIAWTATADKPWIRVDEGAGNGPGQFVVSIVNPNNVLGGAYTLNGTVTIAPGVAGVPATRIPVTLVIDQSAGVLTAPPFGIVDTPLQNAGGVVGTIGITGWALDDVGVAGVKVYRNCLSFEPAGNCQNVAGRDVVFVGDATLVNDARADIEALYPAYPQAYRAAWGYLLLTNLLPHVPSGQMFGGHGTLTFQALATDVEGKQQWLGRALTDHSATLVSLANDVIDKPFGAIDTPAQGATISGSYANFGWALTPDSNDVADATDIFVPTDGSTIRVFIDGVPGAAVTYNQCRGTIAGPMPSNGWCNDDVASVFGNAVPEAPLTPRSLNPTKLRNLDRGRGAIGAYVLDTTKLSNGVHTIMWGVTDSAGRSEGLGSRYFTVMNGGARADERPGRPARPAGDVAARPVSDEPVTGRVGIDLSAPLRPLTADAEGVRVVRIEPMERLELHVGAVDEGYWLANGTLRNLPVGANLDGETGVFTWMPGVGFFGSYRFVFLRDGSRVPVDVVIEPRTAAPQGQAALRMQIDTPVAGATVRDGFTLAGWALDPQAAIGAGVDAIHVWAWRQNGPSADPIFLGTAALNGERPDVAAQYGRAFGTAGFSLTAPALEPGTYTVTAYVWAARTARWEDARSVVVTVR